MFNFFMKGNMINEPLNKKNNMRVKSRKILSSLLSLESSLLPELARKKLPLSRLSIQFISTIPLSFPMPLLSSTKL